MLIAAFWVVIPCSLVDGCLHLRGVNLLVVGGYQYFGGMYGDTFPPSEKRPQSTSLHYIRKSVKAVLRSKGI
jgi:hypothetical protein